MVICSAFTARNSSLDVDKVNKAMENISDGADEASMSPLSAFCLPLRMFKAFHVAQADTHIIYGRFEELRALLEATRRLKHLVWPWATSGLARPRWSSVTFCGQASHLAFSAKGVLSGCVVALRRCSLANGLRVDVPGAVGNLPSKHAVSCCCSHSARLHLQRSHRCPRHASA